jgi:hypothetical protein
MKLLRSICAALIFAFVLLAWWRSYRTQPVLIFYANNGNISSLSSIYGSTEWVFSSISAGKAVSWSSDFQWDGGLDFYNEFFDDGHGSPHLGFVAAVRSWAWDTSGTRGKAIVIVIPYWFWCSLAAISPIMAVRRLIKRRRPKPGLCAVCGYDLRATPNRCPECGTISDGFALEQTRTKC